MKIQPGQVDHDQVSGVSADDHHAQLHAAAHAENAADEIVVENLGGTSVDLSAALRPDGTGGVEFADVKHSELTSVTSDQHHAQTHATAHKDGGADELDAEELATQGAANTFLAADGAGAATMRAIAQGDLPANNALIVTGEYTGDGELSQAITGLGVAVKYVMATRKISGDDQGTIPKWTTDVIVDDSANGVALDTVGNVNHHTIIAVGAGSFTVDDEGFDRDPNKLNQVYNFIVLGV